MGKAPAFGRGFYVLSSIIAGLGITFLQIVFVLFSYSYLDLGLDKRICWNLEYLMGFGVLDLIGRRVPLRYVL